MILTSQPATPKLRLAPPMERVTHPRVRFGPFEFDPIVGDLFRDGRRVRLQEQPRLVLVALLAHPGEVATREELRERLWPSDTFVDFEHGLNTAIKKVRQALGDSADAPQFIETLARRGYRFIAPVAQSPSPAAAAAQVDPSPAPIAPAAARPTVQFLALTLALLVLTSIAVAISFSNGRNDAGGGPLAHGATAQLAVMPFRVLAGGDQASYVGVGIADAITTRLANIRQIVVRPTATVLKFANAQSDPVGVASALRVEYLLLGTIQPAEQTYRVSVQLVGADGALVWGVSYDEPRATLLQLQDRLAEQIAAALRVQLSPPERARLHVRYTQNPAAYDHYLRGRALLVNYTETNMREALEQFEQALSLDENYALARAALATGAAWFSVRYAYETEAQAWGKRADREARRALDQDPLLADAHLAIGSAAGTLYGGFNWPVVLERTSEALALDPSLDLAHVVRMRALYHLGVFDAALEEAEAARESNPFPNIEAERLEIVIRLFSGRFAVAGRQAADLIALKRSDMAALPHYLGLARYYMGDVAGARETLAGVTRAGQPDVRAQASLASIEAAVGLRRQARERATAVAGGPYMDHHVAYSLGAAFAQLGDLDRAVVWLRRSADTGFPCYPWFQQDPLLDPLRHHPRFVTLIDDLRRQHETAVRPAK